MPAPICGVGIMPWFINGVCETVGLPWPIRCVGVTLRITGVAWDIAGVPWFICGVPFRLCPCWLLETTIGWAMTPGWACCKAEGGLAGLPAPWPCADDVTLIGTPACDTIVFPAMGDEALSGVWLRTTGEDCGAWLTPLACAMTCRFCCCAASCACACCAASCCRRASSLACSSACRCSTTRRRSFHFLLVSLGHLLLELNLVFPLRFLLVLQADVFKRLESGETWFKRRPTARIINGGFRSSCTIRSSWLQSFIHDEHEALLLGR